MPVVGFCTHWHLFFWLSYAKPLGYSNSSLVSRTPMHHAAIPMNLGCMLCFRTSPNRRQFHQRLRFHHVYRKRTFCISTLWHEDLQGATFLSPGYLL
jgi:hypothetical protein